MKISPTLLFLSALSPLIGGCGSKSPDAPTAPIAIAPAPMVTPSAEIAPTALPTKTTNPTAKAQTYRGRGQVVEVPAKNGATVIFIVIKHEDIPGLMSAMQMRFPLKVPADGQKLKPGDKIAFDLDKGTLKVSNIKKLPASTVLKLAP